MVYKGCLQDVLEDNNLTLKIFQDTMKLRRIDANINEACEEMREVINKGLVSSELTPEVLKDILEFIRNKIEYECNERDDYTIFRTIILMEDDVFDKYKFEIEEIERAFDLYLDAFKEFDVIFLTIAQCKLIPKIEELYMD